MAELTSQEQALLSALREASGRVLGRAQLAQRLEIQNLSPRRVDSLLTNVRKHVGAEAIVTVRGRGWRLVSR